jgi:hypothetical protein
LNSAPIPAPGGFVGGSPTSALKSPVLAPGYVNLHSPKGLELSSASGHYFDINNQYHMLDDFAKKQEKFGDIKIHIHQQWEGHVNHLKKHSMGTVKHKKGKEYPVIKVNGVV